MTEHVFVDETKNGDYILVASVVPAGDRNLIRGRVNGLVLPRQRRVHMKDERDSRKRIIADVIASTGVHAYIYDAGQRYRNERERRAACLRALVPDMAHRGCTMLIIEQDDTLLSWDNQLLIELTRAAGCRDTLRYEHQRAATERLLALPDAIAWCYAKGGHWRRRIEPVILRVREV